MARQFAKLLLDGWRLADQKERNRRKLRPETYRGAFADLCAALDASGADGVSYHPAYWRSRWEWPLTEVRRFLADLVEAGVFLRKKKRGIKGSRLSVPGKVVPHFVPQVVPQVVPQESEYSCGFDGYNVPQVVPQVVPHNVPLITRLQYNYSSSRNSSADGGGGKKKFWGSDEDVALAKRIYKAIQVINAAAKKPNWNSWANDIRLMRQQDKRNHQQIWWVFDWANRDQFWQSNILSPGKLRKQFDGLLLKMPKVHAVAPPPEASRLCCECYLWGVGNNLCDGKAETSPACCNFAEVQEG